MVEKDFKEHLVQVIFMCCLKNHTECTGTKQLQDLWSVSDFFSHKKFQTYTSSKNSEVLLYLFVVNEYFWTNLNLHSFNHWKVKGLICLSLSNLYFRKSGDASILTRKSEVKYSNSDKNFIESAFNFVSWQLQKFTQEKWKTSTYPNKNSEVW